MLTDTALRNLKPGATPYKLADRDGMYVTVSTAGTIAFRYDYRLNGRRETLTIGRYGPAGIAPAHRAYFTTITRFRRLPQKAVTEARVIPVIGVNNILISMEVLGGRRTFKVIPWLITGTYELRMYVMVEAAGIEPASPLSIACRVAKCTYGSTRHFADYFAVFYKLHRARRIRFL